MKRAVETYVLPLLYLAVLGLMTYAAAMEWAENPGEMDLPVRGDMATTPDWQPVPATRGACREIVRPSEAER